MDLHVPRLSKLLGLSGPASDSTSENPALRGLRRAEADLERYAKYQRDPVGYFREVLGVQPWAGCNGQRGQLELIQAIGESVAAQLDGKPAVKWFKADAAHGVGKTYGAAGLVNWWFDCFTPSIAMTTAPTAVQVEKLLWKDIKKLRPADAPGEVLSLELRRSADHFAMGRTVTDAGGKGTERFQGQHGPFLLFVLDEGEGLPPFVFGSVEAMMTGGVVICLMLANPKTRTSPYYRKGLESGVERFRLSALDHPNVVYGRDVVPHATSRDWVNDKIVKWCDPVDAHNDDDFTYSVPWSVPKPEEEGGGEFAPGQIFRPSDQFLFRVLGIAPKNTSIDTFVSPGRYEAAVERGRKPIPPDRPEQAWMGLDVARYGNDLGSLFERWNGKCWRVGQLAQANTYQYVDLVKRRALELHRAGVKKLHIRVDGTGGYGAGIVDKLLADQQMRAWFRASYRVVEVSFGAGAHDPKAYANVVTELYAEAAEALKGVALVNPPAELEGDLTTRSYRWRNVAGHDVKLLQPKEDFKKDNDERSPDDGDGLVLCLAPDHLFKGKGSDWSGWD